MKLFWLTTGKIHFISENSNQSRFMYIETVCLWQIADDKRLYFNTISDLTYIDNGHGISLTDYPNNFIMVFDLTSTQQASHDFIHPELTNCSISVELKFSVSLPNNIEVFIIGEKASTIFVDSARRVSKNHILTN